MADNIDNKFEKKDSDALQASDWFLEALVDFVNHGEGTTGFGVILNVGGLVISGNLVSVRRYFEGFGKDFGAGLSAAGRDDDTVKHFEQVFSQLGKSYATTLDVEKDEELPPPRYIHLENAKFYFPGQQPVPQNRGVWWRGRISHVDGFILGSLSANAT